MDPSHESPAATKAEDEWPFDPPQVTYRSDEELAFASPPPPPLINPDPWAYRSRSAALASSSSSSGYESSDSRFESPLEGPSDSAIDAPPGLLYQDHSKGPKRPMNAFIHRRSAVQQSDPSLKTAGEISKRLSLEWKNLSEKDRAFYLEQARVLKAEFHKTHPSYQYRCIRKKHKGAKSTGRRRSSSSGSTSSSAGPPTPDRAHSPEPLPTPDVNVPHSSSSRAATMLMNLPPSARSHAFPEAAPMVMAHSPPSYPPPSFRHGSPSSAYYSPSPAVYHPPQSTWAERHPAVNLFMPSPGREGDYELRASPPPSALPAPILPVPRHFYRPVPTLAPAFAEFSISGMMQQGGSGHEGGRSGRSSLDETLAPFRQYRARRPPSQ